MADHRYAHLHRVSSRPAWWEFGRRLPVELRDELRWWQGFMVLIVLGLVVAALWCAAAAGVPQ